jgi:hypothetical protein
MSKLRLPLLALVMLVGLAVPAAADQGVEVDHAYEYGYFYGTFDPVTNVFMTAGAPAEDFCPDGFEGSPAITTSRTSVDEDGSVHVRARTGGVEIHLYDVTGYAEAPPWISDVCAGLVDAEAFASGVGVMEIHDTYLFAEGPPARLFNSVDGHAFGSDGSKYRVHASAEIPFDGGDPVGTPPEWVSFELTQLGG